MPLNGNEKVSEDNHKDNVENGQDDKEERSSLVVDESFVVINPPNKKG